MRTLLFAFLLPFLVDSKPSFGLPEIKVHQDRSINGIPSIDIKFPDGHEDSFVLERHYMSEEDKLARKMHCNFIGHLLKDQDACVAVTGCPGDKLEFTINSVLAETTGMFVMHENGHLEVVNNPFEEESARSETLHLDQDMRDDEGWELVDGDEMENAAQLEEEMQFAASCNAGQCSSLPATNLMRVKVGYDNTFLSDSGSSTAAASYLDSMFTHVQTYFCHSSLGSKIKLERDGGYTHHSGQNWRAESDSGSLDGPIKSITYASSSNAHLFVYLCKDPAFSGVIGLAWVGTLCGPSSWKGYKASINEKRQNSVATAKVVAHEMGHNMGMLHDFDNVHGGSGGACNGQGLMSYGNTPTQWSTCSRNDYLARYNQVGGFNWCMAADSSACGGTTTPTNPPPTPPPSTPNACAAYSQHPTWYQDQFCDDIFNTPECNYDGGDCCIHKRSNWFWYCSVRYI